MKGDNMLVKNLIIELQKYNPDEEVVIMSYDGTQEYGEHDDYREHIITSVHDGFIFDIEHGMVSIECNRDPDVDMTSKAM